MTVDEIFKKLEAFSIKHIRIDAKRIKLQIQVQDKENLAATEKNIQNLLPGYETQITFIFEKEKKQTFKKIIGVSSGKGGVGKSSVALNLAFALAEQGFNVGILDADLYSPSIPLLLNLTQTPFSQDGQFIDPVKFNEKISVLSMGLFLKDNQSPLWKVNMADAAFRQFLEQGNWDCDYLIIDFPPGVSAIHASCIKLARETEMLLVGTPSKIVYADLFRNYVYLRAVGYKVLGMVDNLAYTICKKCSDENHFSSEFDLKELNRLLKIPVFDHFRKLVEDGYAKDYKLQEESEIFHKLANLII
jgi:Mrp family chromosome partitioning ATPase